MGVTNHLLTGMILQVDVLGSKLPLFPEEDKLVNPSL